MTALASVQNGESGLGVRIKINQLIDRQAKVFHLEDYGGYGLDTISAGRTLTVTGISKQGSGSSARMRLTTSTSPSGLVQNGASIVVSGANNAANNGRWWVHTTTSTYIEVSCPNVVAETPSGTCMASWLDARVRKQSFGSYDNRDAMRALLADAWDMVSSPLSRPFAIAIELGAKIYPISAGIDIKGFSNLIIRGPGRAKGGFFLIDGSISADNPHLFYAIQGFGDLNTVNVDIHDLFVTANAGANTVTAGDYGRSGTGDLIHIDQKLGGDTFAISGAVATATPSAAASQFDSTLVGVDPQIRIWDCILENAPRNGIYLRGRGKCVINDNWIEGSGLNGIRGTVFDSHTADNTITESGENAMCWETGTNNLNHLRNHYYFNGKNTLGYLSSADTLEVQENRLAAVYGEVSNIWDYGTRYEDTSGPAIALLNPEIVHIDSDFNNLGTLGPTGSNRDNIYSTIPALASDSGGWFGLAGIPAIKVAAGGSNCKDLQVKARWRGGRSGCAINTWLRIANQSGLTKEKEVRDIKLELDVGHFYNDANDPKINDPGLVGTYGFAYNYFANYMTVDESIYHNLAKNVRVLVDGRLDNGWHGRSHKAWYLDVADPNDRVVVVETAAPTRFNVSSTVAATDSGWGFKLTCSLSTDLTTLNQPLIYQAAEAFGLSGGTVRRRIINRAEASDTLTLGLPSAGTSEGSPSGAYLVVPARGETAVLEKPVGIITRYVGKTIGVNGSGDVASMLFSGLGGTVASFTIDRTGEVVTTVVDASKLEQIAPTVQTETLTDAAYLMKPSDFGKTLEIPASTSRAITFGAASTYPVDWYADLVLTGAGSLAPSGPVNAANVTTQWKRVRFARVGANIVQSSFS